MLHIKYLFNFATVFILTALIIQVRCVTHEPNKDGKVLESIAQCSGCATQVECEPIDSNSTWTQCIYKGKEVRCDQEMRPSTVATSNCRMGYTSAEPTEFNTSCLENGQWSKPQQQCQHICGTIKRFQMQGDVLAHLHPYNAAIYLRVDSKVSQICGGTLIAPSAILTAAYCVHDQRLGTVRSVNTFVIGLGKEHRTFKHSDDINAEYKNVSNIYIPSLYDGRSSNFLLDIAILELESAVTLSSNILPACIDENNEFILSTGSKGTVVGWTYNGDTMDVRDNKESNGLLEKIELPFISLDECKKNLKLHKHVLTKDKFCAFSVEKNITTGVNMGSAGAGLIFEFNDRHYVMGLASTRINTISTFTDIRVPVHLDFIIKTVQSITRKTKQ